MRSNVAFVMVVTVEALRSEVALNNRAPVPSRTLVMRNFVPIEVLGVVKSFTATADVRPGGIVIMYPSLMFPTNTFRAIRRMDLEYYLPPIIDGVEAGGTLRISATIYCMSMHYRSLGPAFAAAHR